MGIVDKLKSMMGGGSDTKAHSYQCDDCGAKFESTAHHPEDAECTDCGSDNIHTAV